MTIRIWKGGTGSVQGTQRVQMTSTWLISSNTNTHTFILSATNPSGTDTATTVTILTVTADGVFTTTQLADQIVAAWNASAHEYAIAVTASNVANLITFTADTAGIPFIISKTGTGTSTLTSNVIANQGPNDYSVPSNWADGIVPVAGDSLIITNHPNGQAFDILYGLAQSTVALIEFKIDNFSGSIGTWATPLHFDVDAFLFNSQSAVGYFKMVASGTIAAVNIQATGNRGNYGCYFEGLSSTITALTISGGSTFLGYQGRISLNGLAVTTLELSGGKVRSETGIVQVNQTGGELHYVIPFVGGATTITGISIDDGYLYLDSTATLTLLTVNGGHFQYNTGGPITTLTANGGLVELTMGKQTFTIGTLNQRGSAVVRFDTAYVTVTTFNRTGPIEYRAAPTQVQPQQGGKK
jgi:hypothetical protein